MGEAAGELRQQPHVVEGLGYPFIPFRLGQVEAIGVQALGHDVVHLGPLIEGGHGVLEDHLNPPGHLPVQLPGDAAVDLAAVKDHFAPGGRVDADDGPADGGLA